MTTEDPIIAWLHWLSMQCSETVYTAGAADALLIREAADRLAALARERDDWRKAFARLMRQEVDAAVAAPPEDTPHE